MPIGGIVFPGTGIRADVAYKAMQLGIPLGWLLLLMLAPMSVAPTLARPGRAGP